jgi:hypothetical protein
MGVSCVQILAKGPLPTSVRDFAALNIILPIFSVENDNIHRLSFIVYHYLISFFSSQ